MIDVSSQLLSDLGPICVADVLSSVLSPLVVQCQSHRQHDTEGSTNAVITQVGASVGAADTLAVECAGRLGAVACSSGEVVLWDVVDDGAVCYGLSVANHGHADVCNLSATDGALLVTSGATVDVFSLVPQSLL
jgi:hypothetical protein